MALLLSGFVGYVLVKALHLGQRREALPMTGPYGREASIQSGTQQYPGQMSGAQVSSSGAGDSASLGPGTGAAGRSVTGPGVFDTAPASTRGNGTVPGQGSIQPGLLPSAPASVQSLDQYPGQSASARGPAMPGAPQGSGAQGASPEIMVTPPVPAQPAVATAPVTAPATMDDDVSAQVTALSAQVSELASEVAALMPRGQNGAAVQAARAAVSTGHARERTRHVYVKHARRWGAIGGTATRSASIEGYSLKEIAPARDGESGDRATVVAPDGTTIDVRAGSSIGGTTVTSVDADAGVVHTLKGDIH